MWTKFIKDLSDEYKFQSPALDLEIINTEQSLEISLPDDLKNLLKESNGIFDKYGDLIWSVKRIKTDNLEFRLTEDFKELYMPFDCLLFFADAGNGDQFAYTILDKEIRRNDIFVWNHEDDSRTWIASTLKQFIEKWIKGEISIN